MYKRKLATQIQHVNEWKAHQTNNLASLSNIYDVTINDVKWEFNNHFKVGHPLVRYVREQGGRLTLELPRYYSYWPEPLLVELVRQYGMHVAKSDDLIGSAREARVP